MYCECCVSMACVLLTRKLLFAHVYSFLIVVTIWKLHLLDTFLTPFKKVLVSVFCLTPKYNLYFQKNITNFNWSQIQWYNVSRWISNLSLVLSNFIINFCVPTIIISNGFKIWLSSGKWATCVKGCYCRVSRALCSKIQLA